VEELERQDRQETGPQRAVVGPQRLDRRLEGLDPIVVGDAEGGRLASGAVGDGRQRQGLRVTPCPGQASGLEQGLAMARVTGAALRLSQGDQQLHAPRLVPQAMGHREQSEGLPVVGHRLVVGEQGQRPGAGAGGVVHRSGGILRTRCGTRPMIGQRRQVLVVDPGVEGLDGRGHPTVEGRPAGGGELVMERGPDDGVGEPVPERGVGHLEHQTCRGRLVQRRQQRLLGEPSRLLHHRWVELRPDDRRHAKDLAGLLAQATEPHPHDLANTLRDPEFTGWQPGLPASLLPLELLRLGKVADDLADEEGVALRPLVDRLGHGQVVLVEIMAADPLQESDDRGLVQPGQRESLHPNLPAQIGQQVGQRVMVADLSVAVGAHHEEPRRLWGARDVAQQQQGRLGRPV
jgi:hypothetical protein